MNDVYYIIVTVIFGVFVLIMAWWIYRYMRKSNPLEIPHEELSEDQKALIYNFCGEMKRARLENEKQALQEKDKQEKDKQEKPKSKKRGK